MILFGYAQGRGLRAIRDLSEGEASAFRRAVAHLRMFDHSSLLLHLVQVAHSNLARVIGRIDACDPLRDVAQWDEMLELEFEFDGTLINFLTAFRTYLDHTGTRLHRQYGKDSPQARAYRAATVRAYDSSFAYRFMSKLRNYVQHAGFPAWNHWADGTAPNGVVLRMIRLLEAAADPAELLEHGGDLWGPVRRDLEQRTERVSIRACADALRDDLACVDHAVRESEAPELRASAGVVNHTVSDALARGEYPMVAESSVADGVRRLTFWHLPRTVLGTYGCRLPEWH